MLQQILLLNFALIERLELDLPSGFIVMTGETGAGKSIIIDAIELALGSRLEGSVVGTNGDRCDIYLNFDLTRLTSAKRWLEQHDLHVEHECIVRRSITKENRSRSYINGQPVPLQLAREFGELLVNIHGQHQHQLLLKSDYQRILLDEYAAHQPLCSEVKQLYQTIHTLETKLKQCMASTHDQNARKDLLQFQLIELDKLALQADELEHLDQEHKQLINAESLIHACDQAQQLIYATEDQNAFSAIQQALQPLEPLRTLNPKINSSCVSLENASLEIQEASHDLQAALEQINLDPGRLQEIEMRLAAIHDMARKHRVQARELLNLQQSLATELASLEHADVHIADLQQELDQLNQAYQTAVTKLSTSRLKAAKKLQDLIVANMQQLGMQGGQFKIALIPQAQISPHGLEKIEFQVAANPGQALQALNKVASGGELSRISLAIQVITAKQVATPTLIFDEVDVGIGGGIAEIVGRLLQEIGQNTQTLCITHSPQVASLGQHHLQVSKQNHKGQSLTKIKILDNIEKIEEIARMLGGVNITAQTRAHAKEMLALQTDHVTEPN